MQRGHLHHCSNAGVRAEFQESCSAARWDTHDGTHMTCRPASGEVTTVLFAMTSTTALPQLDVSQFRAGPVICYHLDKKVCEHFNQPPVWRSREEADTKAGREKFASGLC